MSTVHTELPAATEARSWAERVLVREMWASLAIVAIWLSVLFDAIYGPDFVTSNAAGTTTTTIPSVVFVAVFAYLATRVVARYGFTGRSAED
jgi:hypothetical protein